MAIQLTSGLLSSRSVEEELDPMASLANLADVMLVFACGLMMAVVVAWNVDTTQMSEISEQDKLSEVENIEEMQQELSATAGDSYVDMGKVYMDPATGKYYMVVENDVNVSTSTNAEDAAAGDTPAAGATDETAAGNTAVDITPAADNTPASDAATENAAGSTNNAQ